MTDLSPSDLAKFAAARRSVDFVEDGMKLGLGTGSTAAWMVRCVAAKARAENLRLTCVPTSERTAVQAKALGLNVVSLDEAGWLDLTIDGADEFDPQMRLIKGGGGAHLREMIVAAASDQMVVITDPGKQVAQLGAFALPIEVVPFGIDSTMTHIRKVLESADVAGREIALRSSEDGPFYTDEGNCIIDAALGQIGAPEALTQALNAIPGVVENGLFIGLCDRVVIGHGDGKTETLSADEDAIETGQVDPNEAASLPG
ncbi:MAG: ribose-5-phosphate isomerase RpiA [Mangrovicoccus sp.]|nr:ribose-5-phosphate isomerase RpiA [Mangrovicoccus sp.]